MAAGTASVAVGCLVLCGWALDIERLKQVAPGLVAMDPMTAVAFILAGLALLLVRVQQRGPTTRRLAQLFAVSIAVIGLSKLGSIVFAATTGVDQLLFSAKLGGVAGAVPNRMAPNTALNFVLVGLALLFGDRSTRSGYWPAQWLVFTAGTMTMLPLIGYAYGITSFIGIGSFIPMAVHTAVTFLIIELGILAACPRGGFMTMFTSDTSGGIIARRLLPTAIMVPMALGWLRLAGEDAGLYSAELGAALLTTATIIIFTIMIAGNANQLYRGDAELRRTEQALRIAKDTAETANRALTRAIDDLQEQIAERQRVEQELQTFATALERSNGELQNFASVASHDLQEPLRKIIVFGDRLATKAGDALNAEGRDYLARMQASANRMQTLINDLMTFSRVSTRAQPFERVDLAVVARDVLCDLEVRIEQVGGHVEVGSLPIVAADPTQMRQLLQNLIGNALKFRKPDQPPRVKVSSAPMNNDGAAMAQIAVEDNGIGFDEKYLDRIFAIFQRLHGRTTYEGSGIGLAVCRKIVERHGGTITARSRPGEGTTFIVTLPARLPGTKEA